MRIVRVLFNGRIFRVSVLYALGALISAELFLLPGCKVGPEYRAPRVTTPRTWTATNAGELGPFTSSLARWWTNFGDPILNSLINRAITSNRELQMAAARVRMARALRGATAADLLPTIGASASLVNARRSRNALAVPVRLFDTDTYQLGFDASWELDLFGGKRRAFEAAKAELQATEEERRAVLVSLLAEVAKNYVELRGNQRRLQIASSNIQIQKEILEITRLRLEKGLASELDVAQSESLLASTEAKVPTLETAVRRSINRIAVLIGQEPSFLTEELLGNFQIPSGPPDVPGTLSADLLLRRPDVRRSERQLEAATARVGAAVSELFPKFVLSGSGGFQSLDAGNLISPGSRMWSAGPSVRWRLLEYPRLRAQINAQTAQQAQALAAFEQTVLMAIEEVENALVSYAREKERFELLRRSVESSRRALDLANELYTKGLGEFINVLVAERTLFENEDALIQSQTGITSNLIALYKALGGGWDADQASN
ncbi:MAG: efflux transporter outer membrane subunit [Verrucomicrobiae bacterium]|nr:efflux transporter outer membrane subunit [Verrucomicrobiae bacterium]